jgi:SPP1 gp7 family putative phage head morphogenesis protein
VAIDAQWWLDEEQELDAILFRHLFAAAIKGAQTAQAALAEEWAAGVDWGLVNEAAMRWARRISPELAATITGTTRKFVTQALSDWVASGRPKAELVDTLKPMFGKVRAQMIGTTEITRAYAEGNRATWKESGVVDGIRWMTGRDELVCPTCSELDGQVLPIDSDDLPPAHVNCRCYTQPVVTI